MTAVCHSVGNGHQPSHTHHPEHFTWDRIFQVQRQRLTDSTGISKSLTHSRRFSPPNRRPLGLFSTVRTAVPEGHIQSTSSLGATPSRNKLGHEEPGHEEERKRRAAEPHWLSRFNLLLTDVCSSTTLVSTSLAQCEEQGSLKPQEATWPPQRDLIESINYEASTVRLWIYRFLFAPKLNNKEQIHLKKQQKNILFWLIWMTMDGTKWEVLKISYPVRNLNAPLKFQGKRQFSSYRKPGETLPTCGCSRRYYMMRARHRSSLESAVTVYEWMKISIREGGNVVGKGAKAMGCRRPSGKDHSSRRRQTVSVRKGSGNPRELQQAGLTGHTHTRQPSFAFWCKVTFHHYVWKCASQSLEEERRDAESKLRQAQCFHSADTVCGVMSSVGVGQLCLIDSRVQTAINSGDFGELQSALICRRNLVEMLIQFFPSGTLQFPIGPNSYQLVLLCLTWTLEGDDRHPTQQYRRAECCWLQDTQHLSHYFFKGSAD